MDMMIDIETLDTLPTAVILSIGAVIFDPNTGEIAQTFKYKINGKSCVDAGLTINFDTIQWWMEQDPEAQKSSFGRADGSLGNALWDLSVFIGLHKPETIWAQGPQFDVVILENAYRAVKKPIPWTYRQIKDCRTMIDYGKIEYTRTKVGHDPLADAEMQVEMLILAFRNLGIIEPKRVRFQPGDIVRLINYDNYDKTGEASYVRRVLSIGQVIKLGQREGHYGTDDDDSVDKFLVNGVDGIFVCDHNLEMVSEVD